MEEQPLHARCPKCGSPMPSEQSYCPNCGNMVPPVSRGHGARPVPQRNKGANIVLFIILFLFVGLPAGAVGACFLVFAQGEPGFIAIGLGGGLLAVLLLVLMIRSMVSR